MTQKGKFDLYSNNDKA